MGRTHVRRPTILFRNKNIEILTTQSALSVVEQNKDQILVVLAFYTTAKGKDRARKRLIALLYRCQPGKNFAAAATVSQIRNSQPELRTDE